MSLRILHVVATDRRRGAEVFASDLVRALAGSRVTQRVAVVRGSDRPAVAYDAPVDILASNGSRQVPGARVRPGAVRRLSEVIDCWAPDVVQVHGGEPLKYVLHTAKNGTPPVVYRRIGVATRENHWGPRRRIHARRMQRASRVVAVAEVLRREAITLFGVPARRIVTIPNAVDPRRLKPARSRAETRRSLGIPPDVPVVLSVGALAWEKDPLAHLAVAGRVREALPETVHVFVGEGPLRSELEAEVRSYGVGERVLVLGPREDVADIMAAADLVVLASKTEGSPGCLIEAAMAGTPAVAYGVGGVPEVLQDGVTGALAPPGDVRALSDRAIELLVDRRLRERMASAAREHSRTFDIASVAPRYLGVYEELA